MIVDPSAARHKKLAFYGVPGTDGKITLHRMKKFTTLSMSKNPTEYNRQYVDEPYTQSDVVGYSPSISYAFDRHSEDVVHKDLIAITDGERQLRAACRRCRNPVQGIRRHCTRVCEKCL